jgi:hypothetical protein
MSTVDVLWVVALGQKYHDNVLVPRVVPHCDNHALADRPMFMDDNARQHRARIVQHFIQQEAVQKIPGLSDYHQERTNPTYSQMKNNPRQLHPHPQNVVLKWRVSLAPFPKINQRNPKCHNCYELRTAILQEWQQFPQNRLRRLVRSMTRHVTELHNKRGGYTRYWFVCLTHTHNRCRELLPLL